MKHKKLGTVIAAGMLAFAANAAAVESDNITASIEEQEERTQARLSQQINAQMRHQLHLHMMGSTTGTRIPRDEPDLSRPVTVIHGDAYRTIILAD